MSDGDPGATRRVTRHRRPPSTIAAMTEGLLEELNDGVLTLTINRPEAANAIPPEVRNRIIEVLYDTSNDLRVRVVVLTAKGKNFCTGADLRVANAAVADAPKVEGSPERAMGDVGRAIRRGAQQLISAVMDCERPVIAAVNGTAAGMGAHLAFACDMIIAADTARFIEVFVRRGISVDGGGAYLLPRMIGVHKTKELMFLGNDLSATEAERIGLINKVVPADELEKATAEWAEQLAKSPTKMIALAKYLVNRSLDGDRATSFHEEAWGQDLMSTTTDFVEGTTAFAERRKPDFKGW
jgi:2-(1,2-epoxy-1,2-dihydrophenyl)acetyl-CoA isomerase